MALDKNLFTLSLEPSKIEPSAIDLVDPSGTIHYRKRLLPSEAGTYLISLSGAQEHDMPVVDFTKTCRLRSPVRFHIGHSGCAGCYKQGEGH